MWTVHLLKVVASSFQWWFSFFKAPCVLQVWWKVATHFGENLWLLVENIRRVGNKENPNLNYVLLHFFQSSILSIGAPHNYLPKIFESAPENLQKTSPKSKPVLTFLHQ